MEDKNLAVHAKFEVMAIILNFNTECAFKSINRL